MTGQQRILVFDTANAEGMAFIVARFGYSAKHVSTMQELLTELKSSRFDLLIVEVCDFDCQQIADELRQIPNCKVLFTTCGAEGHGYPLPTGEECVVEKPIELMQFAQTIRQLLGQSVQ
jgi:CheY-like chemotaxis protein